MFVVLLTYKMFTKISVVETTVIFPVVCMFCIVGVYALNQTLFDVWAMIFFSILGYILLKLDFPPVCMMIGFILSPIFETNFRLAMIISNGSYGIFFKTPVAKIFWGAIVLSLYSVFKRIITRKRGEIAL